MASRRRRRSSVEESGSGLGGGNKLRWMVSYADFMTLLFVVFMVLYSMANVDAAKYHTLAASLRESMGVGGSVGVSVTPLAAGGGGGEVTPILSSPGLDALLDAPDWAAELLTEETSEESSPSAAEASAEETYEPAAAGASSGYSAAPAAPADEMEDLAIAFQNLPGTSSGLLGVALEQRGLTITIAGSVLFDPGQVELRPDARTYLADIARNLEGVDRPILIEGTADHTSTGSGYNPWDLAALRASAVVNYFVNNYGFPGSRFITIGYGSSDGSAHPPEVVTIVVLRESQ